MHALQAVDFLDLVDQVLLEHFVAADPEDVLENDRAVGKLLAGVDLIPLVDVRVLAVRHDVFLGHAGRRFDDD